MFVRTNSTAILAVALLALAISVAPSDASAYGLYKPDFVAYLDSDQTVPHEPNAAHGVAMFRFNRNRTKLFYVIELEGLDLDGFVTLDNPGDDVTKIHFHNAPPGVAGPHILNVFKLPRQDDRDISIEPFEGTIRGIWDDGDENLMGAPSIRLSDAIAILCAGNGYVNVHSVDHAPGALRGQIIPSSRRACRRMGH